MTDAEIDRAAALVVQTPIEHPTKLDRWPYAAVSRRQRQHSLAEDVAVVAVILLLFIATGLLT
jgi:hypothetical protein